MIVSLIKEGGVRLQSGDAVVLIDPVNNRSKADLVLRTEVESKNPIAPEGEITLPGEYEVSGVEVRGMQMQDSSSDVVKIAYAIEFEGIHFAILPKTKEIPSGDVLREIEEPDVLILPVNGKEGLDGEKTEKLIRRLEPSAVVPVALGPLTELYKTLGKSPEGKSDKFTFKIKDLKPKEAKVVELTV